MLGVVVKAVMGFVATSILAEAGAELKPPSRIDHRPLLITITSV